MELQAVDGAEVSDSLLGCADRPAVGWAILRKRLRRSNLLK